MSSANGSTAKCLPRDGECWLERRDAGVAKRGGDDCMSRREDVPEAAVTMRRLLLLAWEDADGAMSVSF